MGCKPSKLEVQQDGNVYNEETDTKRVFLSGVQFGKKNDGLEGGIQISLRSVCSKRYEIVNKPKPKSMVLNV